MQAYGKTTYLITSLQLVPRGTEGAVSLEGTLAGMGAAAVYAAVALALGQVSQPPWASWPVLCVLTGIGRRIEIVSSVTSFAAHLAEWAFLRLAAAMVL